MAIVDMSKFHLTIFQDEKESVLQALQSYNEVHLNDLSQEESWLDQGVSLVDTGEEHAKIAEQLNRSEEAIEILEEYQEEEDDFRKKYSNKLPELTWEESMKRLQSTDIQQVIGQTREGNSKIRKSEEFIRAIQEKKEEYSHWKKLPFPIEKLGQVESINVTLGTLPSKWWESFQKYIAKETETTYVEKVSSSDKTHYILLAYTGEDEGLEQILRDSNFAPVRLDTKLSVADQMKEFDQEIQALEDDISTYKEELNQISKDHLDEIKIYYEKVTNEEVLVEAQDKMVRTDYLSFIEGYVRTEREGEFKKLLEKASPSEVYGLEIHEADRDDPDVPIILENGKLVTPFENVVETYALPKYNEIDPTPLMAPWFAVFFGMMLGDLGYGLLLFIGTTAALHLFEFQDGTRKFLRFFQLCSIPAILAGLAFGSFFGGLVDLPYIIDPTQSYMEMLIISIAIGVVHIFVGLGIQAYMHIRDGNYWYAMVDTGFWYMLLGGLLVFGLSKVLPAIPETAGNIGGILAIIGAIGIVLFSEKEAEGSAKIAWGAYNLYGVTSYVGDFISYSRIMALILSSAFIGLAINIIAGMLFDIGIIGIVFGVLVLIFAHLFNLFLSSLSGYVHSMRLIYVEFFGKFYEGGGVPFKGMQAPAKYVDIKEKSELESKGE